ncbi:MAG: hypothetical protein AB7K68_12760 [Bacteriovoracia bacterium]
MVKKAIEADAKLSAMDITVYAKGSYANRTNIPADSDVDVAVQHNGIFFNDYPGSGSHSDFGFEPATYTYDQFKADVARAIVTYFGQSEVDATGKAIKIRSNTVNRIAEAVEIRNSATHFGPN